MMMMMMTLALWSGLHWSSLLTTAAAAVAAAAKTV